MCHMEGCERDWARRYLIQLNLESSRPQVGVFIRNCGVASRPDAGDRRGRLIRRGGVGFIYVDANARGLA